MSDNKHYARIHEGAVAERFVVPDGLTLEECFHPDVAQCFRSCPADTTIGSTVDANDIWTITPPPPSPAPSPSPAPVPADPDLTLIARHLELVVDDYIDGKARELGYASIVTAVSYADEPAVPKFQAEGRALRAWRSQVYAVAYQLLTEVQAGKRGVPSTKELIAQLPTFVR